MELPRNNEIHHHHETTTTKRSQSNDSLSTAKTPCKKLQHHQHKRTHYYIIIIMVNQISHVLRAAYDHIILSLCVIREDEDEPSQFYWKFPPLRVSAAVCNTAHRDPSHVLYNPKKKFPYRGGGNVERWTNELKERSLYSARPTPAQIDNVEAREAAEARLAAATIVANQAGLEYRQKKANAARSTAAADAHSHVSEEYSEETDPPPLATATATVTAATDSDVSEEYYNDETTSPQSRFGNQESTATVVAVADSDEENEKITAPHRGGNQELSQPSSSPANAQPRNQNRGSAAAPLRCRQQESISAAAAAAAASTTADNARADVLEEDEEENSTAPTTATVADTTLEKENVATQPCSGNQELHPLSSLSNHDLNRKLSRHSTSEKENVATQPTSGNQELHPLSSLSNHDLNRKLSPPATATTVADSTSEKENVATHPRSGIQELLPLSSLSNLGLNRKLDSASHRLPPSPPDISATASDTTSEKENVMPVSLRRGRIQKELPPLSSLSNRGLNHKLASTTNTVSASPRLPPSPPDISATAVADTTLEKENVKPVSLRRGRIQKELPPLSSLSNSSRNRNLAFTNKTVAASPRLPPSPLATATAADTTSEKENVATQPRSGNQELLPLSSSSNRDLNHNPTSTTNNVAASPRMPPPDISATTAADTTSEKENVKPAAQRRSGNQNLPLSTLNGSRNRNLAFTNKTVAASPRLPPSPPRVYAGGNEMEAALAPCSSSQQEQRQRRSQKPPPPHSRPPRPPPTHVFAATAASAAPTTADSASVDEKQAHVTTQAALVALQRKKETRQPQSINATKAVSARPVPTRPPSPVDATTTTTTITTNVADEHANVNNSPISARQNSVQKGENAVDVLPPPPPPPPPTCSSATVAAKTAESIMPVQYKYNTRRQHQQQQQQQQQTLNKDSDQKEKLTRKQQISLAKHRRVSLGISAANLDVEFPARRGSVAWNMDEEPDVSSTSVIHVYTHDDKILLSIFGFLKQNELLCTASLVCTSWATAATNAYANMMMASIGYVDGVETLDTAGDGNSETTSQNSTVSRSMSKDWEYVTNLYPWGCYLAEGTFKKVFKVHNTKVGGIEAVSVMDMDDIHNKKVVATELRVSVMLNSLSRRGVCPNFILTRGVFTSEHGPPESLWGSEKNKMPYGAEYNSEEVGLPGEPKEKPEFGRYQYIRMELCNGGDLEEYLKVQPDMILECNLSRSALFQIAFALHAAADRFSLKHYDLKLLNIFIQKLQAPPLSGDVVLRYGLGAHIFALRMPGDQAIIAKLADYGTANVQSESNGQPVTIGQFTTLENTPPDFMILGDLATLGHGHDNWGLGLCMLHLFTGHKPYEEIMADVTCPPKLREKLKKIWEKNGTSGYTAIRRVILSNSKPDDTLYETIYRYLVLFGVPEENFQDIERPLVWKAIRESLVGNVCKKTGRVRNPGHDLDQFKRDRALYSIKSGSNDYIKDARQRLETMEGGMDLLLSLCAFDPAKRATALQVLNSPFMSALREEPNTTYGANDDVRSFTAFSTNR